MWKKPLAVLGASALICGGEIAREVSTFRVRRYRIRVPGMKRGGTVRMLYLSDLHGKEYGKENENLLAKIGREDPDLILVGGDMLTRTQPDTDRTAAALLGRLASLCPVFAANGNHEQKMKEQTDVYGDRYARYREKLLNHGVHLLENRTMLYEKEGLCLPVTGLEIPLACYRHLGKGSLSAGEVEKAAGPAGTDGFHILLAHNPMYMDAYWGWGADLVLSGHLHGGVLRLPGLGGVITPQMQLFPQYSGDMYKKDGQTCIVSRGLGTHTVHVRLFNMAELVSVVFTGA